ncbi:MAG: ATP-binding protein [Parachlamydiales bacterium]
MVTITGPRQSGKTTLVRKVFPDKRYVNLEMPEERELAERDPQAFLERYPNGAILDEIQRVPQLLSYIQVIVDEKEAKGMFILTGSHQLALHAAVAQSLAGRTALLSLLPMSLKELEEAGITLSLDEALYTGGFPAIFQDQLEPTKAYRNYLQTYIERDLHQMTHVHDLTLFQRFMVLCAGRIGQVLNQEGLANEVGVSGQTIRQWLSILEASHIVIRLQPYYENLGKRVIKSPKLYFTDVGLASYLLKIESAEQMSRDPLRGSLIENLVLLELVKARANQGLDPNLYYFRDRRGREIDLIYQRGRELIPIEIKGAQTFNKEFFKNLLFFKELVGERCPVGYAVYAGQQEQRVGEFALLNYRHVSRLLD